jgi:integrase
MDTPTKLYLTKRPNGYYYIGQRLNGKLKWKSTGFRNRTQAQELIQGNTFHIEEQKYITLEQFIPEYIKIHGHNIRPRVLDSYISTIHMFIHYCGNKGLNEYITEDMELFKKSLLKDNQSNASVNMYFRSIKAVFSIALRNGYINQHPFIYSKPLKVSKQPPLFLSQNQLETLLSTVSSPLMKDIFTVAAYTGMRCSEILHAKWDWIDWNTKEITILSDGDFLTKSGHTRIIPIHSKVLAVLKRRYETRFCEYIFYKNPKVSVYGTSIAHEFKKYIRKLGYNEKLHFHSLRHTHASLLVNAGVNLLVIKELLGHSSITTTMIYTHTNHEALHNGIALLT